MNKRLVKFKMFCFKSHCIASILLFRPRVRYLDKTTKKTIFSSKKPFVVAYNHVGYHDTMMLWSVFVRRYVRYIATDEIIKNRISKFFFNWTGVIVISRGNINLAAYTEIRKSLDAGIWVGISPEGHINRTGELGEFHHGAAQFATTSNSSLLPIYIAPNKKIFWQRQVVYMGNPIPPIGSKQEITDRLRNKIIELGEVHKKKTISKHLSKKSLLYVLPARYDIAEEQIRTTFYKKYSEGNRERELSKSAWYYLEKILSCFHIHIKDEDITFSDSGKPMHKDICFNISHCHDLISIIISDQSCSVDCQKIDGDKAKVAEWVKAECTKKLGCGKGGGNAQFTQKEFKHGGSTYIIGAKAATKVKLKKQFKFRSL